MNKWSMIMSETTWEMYFSIFSLLTLTLGMLFKTTNLFFMNLLYSTKTMNTEIKFMMFLSLQSLGSLPPFIGILPKWIIMQSMIEKNLITMISIMAMMTMIMLYYYMRISFSAYILPYTENTWVMKTSNKKSNIILSTMVMISTMELISTSMLIDLY